MIVKILFWIVIVYSSLLAVLYLAQRSLIYYPDKSRPKSVEGVDVIRIQTVDGLNIEGWYFPPRRNDITIVYFHGNGGNYYHRLFKIRAYLRLGYGVLLVGYRGYGGNPGQPSEEGFYKDGRAYLDWLMKNRPDQRIILYGESIGSGTATQLATEYKAAALILEMPFSSLYERAAKRYFYVPVKFLLKDHFLNIDKIENINMPLLVLHGHKDNIIPYDEAKALFEKAKQPKRFIGFPEGNHNNLYEFGAADYVIQFMTGLNVGNRDNR